MREFEEQTRKKHDKLDDVVEGMLGSSIGQNMSDAEREQRREEKARKAKAREEHLKVLAELRVQGMNLFKDNGFFSTTTEGLGDCWLLALLAVASAAALAWMNPIHKPIVH